MSPNTSDLPMDSLAGAAPPDVPPRAPRWCPPRGPEIDTGGDPLPDWFDLAGDPRAELVKRNPLREVFRVRLGSDSYFVKVFAGGGLAATVKRYLFGPPALAEFRFAAALRRAGIGAVRAVAAGVSTADSRSVLITEAFTDGRALSEVWAQIRCTALIESVAGLLAETHNAGALPRDTHPGNLLIRRAAGANGADGWEVAHADLAGMRLGRAVSDVEAARNLAELHQWFRARTTATERLRFLRAYVVARFGAGRAALRRFSGLVEASSRAHERALWRKRDRRIFRSNAYFAVIDVGDGWEAHVALRRRDGPADNRSVATERTAKQWRVWIRERLGPIRSAADALTDGLRVEHRRARGWESVLWRWIGSPARRAFAVTHALRHRDLPAPHAPVLAVRSSFAAVNEAAILLDHPVGAKPLGTVVRAMLRDTAASAPGRGPSFGSVDGLRQVRHLLGALGRLLADMVRCGVTARHLSPDALALVPGNESDEPIICAAGSGGLSVHRRPVRSAVAWMPVCLLRHRPPGLSQTDCLRVLRAFRRRLPPDLRGGDWKTLWRRMEALA